MVKLICHQKGNLFIKCKNCSYSWNTAVVAGQEVDDTCPNCGTYAQRDALITRHAIITHHDAIPVEGTKPTDSVDIPEFMAKPKEYTTLETYEYHSIVREHYKGGRRVGINLGFKSGLIWGLLIGLIILGIVLAILFVPINMY